MTNDDLAAVYAACDREREATAWVAAQLRRSGGKRAESLTRCQGSAEYAWHLHATATAYERAARALKGLL